MGSCLYLKYDNVESYECPKSATWEIRKIISTRQHVMVAPGLQGDLKARLNVYVTGGTFTVKKIYNALTPQLPKVPWKEIILNQSIHPRHKFILWLTLLHRLSTVERLAKFGIQVPRTCVYCEIDDETHDNLFVECGITKHLWMRLLNCLGV